MPTNTSTDPDLPISGRPRADSHLLTVREVADLLRVPPSWVYDHTRPGCREPLPTIKLGKYLRFIASDVLAYLKTIRRPDPNP
jgi:excisionase family DNA binding protein